MKYAVKAFTFRVHLAGKILNWLSRARNEAVLQRRQKVRLLRHGIRVASVENKIRKKGWIYIVYSTASEL